MKFYSSHRLLAVAASIGVAGLLSASSARADMVTFTGDFSPTNLGGSLSTDIPKFNSALGTLTGVQITLDITATPYAEVVNVGSSTPLTFDPTSYTSETFPATSNPTNWTVTYGTDSWSLTAPTVSTGAIFGSNQSVPQFTALSFLGSSSAPANLTDANASIANLAAYIGAGNLVFGIQGPGSFVGGGPFYNFGYGLGGGGADLTSTDDNTSSVTYTYTTPEPGSLGLLAIGGIGFLINRRKKA